MKKGFMLLAGLFIWGGLLMLQGTPKIDGEIAAQMVEAVHPQAEIVAVEDTMVNKAEAYKIAYFEAGQGAGSVTIDADGHVLGH
ncbi:hypothetical protein [Mitsuokella sp. AF21-1AC]|uniref:hypothetical protein n=1 Tax=Mitsuokella sp. AF21-1AC TaxID=2292235 RepID=UPI000E4984D2|nr:hypothetical protein [Mitsuokella sp. AF21-1AC]RGS70423.1 hypothetical protein DWX75_10700 [Mitsuokella sp. AF21-1AC]